MALRDLELLQHLAAGPKATTTAAALSKALSTPEDVIAEMLERLMQRALVEGVSLAANELHVMATPRGLMVAEQVRRAIAEGSNVDDLGHLMNAASGSSSRTGDMTLSGPGRVHH